MVSIFSIKIYFFLSYLLIFFKVYKVCYSQMLWPPPYILGFKMQFLGFFSSNVMSQSNCWSFIQSKSQVLTKVSLKSYISSLFKYLEYTFSLDSYTCILFLFMISRVTLGILIALLSQIISRLFQVIVQLIMYSLQSQPLLQYTIETNSPQRYKSLFSSTCNSYYLVMIIFFTRIPCSSIYIMILLCSMKFLSLQDIMNTNRPLREYLLYIQRISLMNREDGRLSGYFREFSVSRSFFIFCNFQILLNIPTEKRLYSTIFGYPFGVMKQSSLVISHSIQPL